MKSSVIIIPGSNCDRDMDVALKKFGFKNQMVWHNDKTIPKSDLIVLPGGFSYGDYLRCGSIASKSNITFLLCFLYFPIFYEAKRSPRRLYTNRGSRTKHCQAAPSCHQRQPLTRKVGDRVPKQWLRCVSCWPIKAGVLSSATLAVWRAVLTGELNVKNEPERSISLV